MVWERGRWGCSLQGLEISSFRIPSIFMLDCIFPGFSIAIMHSVSPQFPCLINIDDTNTEPHRDFKDK